MSQNSKKEEARTSVQNTESPINKSSNDNKEVQESGTNETQKPTQAKVKHPQRRKVVGHYYIEEEIGEGTFGKVRKGQHKLTKESVAIKILEKNRISDVTDVERVAREIHILKLIRHPNIVQLYEIIETPGQLYLIMEFASGGELFDYIVKKTRIPEQEACKFFQQIMAGVEYIHSLNIVHRDLKPENLLLDHHNNIKIVDFGLSNTFSQNEYLKTACGSPCYAAPEMIAGLKYKGDKVDLWSCGVILYALVCGFLPFEDPDTTKLYKKILKGRYIIPGFISANVVDLIGNILTQDPEQRPGIGKIREHPWFKLSSPVCMNKGIIVGYSQIHHDPKALLELDKLSLQTNVKLSSSEQISFNREHTIRCLDANKHNHETTCYYLMLAKLQKNGTVSPLSQYKHVISQLTSPHENTLKFKLQQNVASPDGQAKSNHQEQQRDTSLGKKNATAAAGVTGSKKRHSSVQRSTTTSNNRQLQLNNMNKLRQLDRKDQQQNLRTAKEQVSLDLCSPVAAKMAHQGGSSTDRKNSAKPPAQNVYTKKKLANDLLRFEQQRMNQDVVNQEYADGKAGREARQSGPKQLHKSLIDSDDTFGSLILETEKSNVPKISTLNPVPENHQVNVTKSANSMMSGNQVSSKNRNTVKVKNAVRGGIEANSKGQSPRAAFAATGEENVSHIQPSYVSSPRNIASVFYPQTNHVQSQMNSIGSGGPIQNQIHFDDNSFIQDIVNRSTSLDTQQKKSQMVVRHRNIANQQAVSSAQHQQHQLSQQFNTLRHPPAAAPHGIKHQVFQTKQNSQDMSYPMVTNTTSSLRPQHNSFSQDQHQHMLTQGNNFIKVGSHKRQPKQSLVNKRRTNHGTQHQYQQALLAGTTSSALSVTAGGAQVVNASSAVGTYRRPSNMRASTLGPTSDGQHQHHAVMQNAQQHSNNNVVNSGSSQNRLQYSSRSSSKKGGRATSSSRKKMIDQGKIIQLNLSAIGKESSGITASLGGGHHSSSTDKKMQKAIGSNHVSGGAGGRIKRINNGGGGNTLITNSSNVLSGQVALDCTGDQNNESAMHNSMVQHWHSSNLINVDTTTFGGIDSVNTTALINNSSLALAGAPANNQYNTATSANVSLSTIPAKTLPSEPTTRVLPSRNSVLRINNHKQSDSQQQQKNEAVQSNQAAQVSVRTLAKNRLPPTKKQQLIQNLQETIEEQKRRQDHQTSTAAVAQNTSGNLATSTVPTHNIQLKLIQQFQKAVNQVPQQHQSNPYSRPSRGGVHATSKQNQVSANNNQQQQRRKSSQQSANRAKEIASVSASGTNINLTSGRVVGGGAVLKSSNKNKMQQQSSESNSVNQTMVYPQKWHKKHQQQLSGLAIVEDNNKELFQSYQHGDNTNYNLNDSGVNLSYATMVNNTLINQNQNKSIASQNMQILNQSAATISPDYHSMTNLRITASSAASDNDNSPDQRAPQKNYQSSTVINSIKANKKGAPQRAGHHHRHSLGSGVLAISNAQGASSITRPQRASEQQNSKQSYKPGRKLTTAASSQNNTQQQAIAFRRNSAQQHQQQQQQSNKQYHTRVNSQASQRSSKQNYNNQQQQQLAYQGSSARGSDLNHKQQQYAPMTSQQQYTDNGGQVSNETINTAGVGMQHGRRKIHIARTTRNHHLVQQSQNQTSRQRVSNSNRNSITNPVQLTGQTNQTKKPPIKHSQQLKQASRRVAPLNMISTSSAYLENGNNSMNLLNHHPNSVSGYVRISSKTRGDIFADEPRIGVVASSDSPSAGQQQQHNASFQAIMHGGGIHSPLNIVQQDSMGLHNQSISLPQQHQSQLNQMQQKQRLVKKTALGQSRLYASQQKNRKEQPSGISAVEDSSNVSLHVNEQTNSSGQWMQQYGAAGAPANGKGNSSSQQFSAQANQQAQDQAASSHYVVIPAWHMDNSVHKQ